MRTSGRTSVAAAVEQPSNVTERECTMQFSRMLTISIIGLACCGATFAQDQIPQPDQQPPPRREGEGPRARQRRPDAPPRDNMQLPRAQPQDDAQPQDQPRGPRGPRGDGPRERGWGDGQPAPGGPGPGMPGGPRPGF